MQTSITIVGAGVSGLTCSIRLLQAGYRVQIRSRDLPQNTTSNVAAAFWYPYLVEPQSLCAKWAGRSYHEFLRLADDDTTGVCLRQARILFVDPFRTLNGLGSFPHFGALLRHSYQMVIRTASSLSCLSSKCRFTSILARSDP